jgi:hypothetical protein
MTTPFEYFQGAKKMLSSGDRIKDSQAILNNDGTYKKKESKGVFPEAKDHGILGRGSADIIIKEDELLIRAGKTNRLSKTALPVANTTRAFLQLSKFTQKKEELEPETQIKTKTEVKVVQKMVVWDITNLENQQNAFTGSVGLYTVKPNEKTNSSNFKVHTITQISNGTDYSGPLELVSFRGVTFDEAVTTINDFIVGVFDQFKNSKFADPVLNLGIFVDRPLNDMKNPLIAALVSLCPFLFFAQKESPEKLFSFKIEGTIRNYKAGKIYLHHKWNEKEKSDSAKVSNGRFELRLNYAGSIHVVVTNTMGKVVYEAYTSKAILGPIELNVKSGMYQVRVEGEDFSITKPLVIQP